MKNLIKDIMVKAGYAFDSDNRSYHTRSINSLLNDGRIEVVVCETGKVWRNDDNTRKWNIIIKAAGRRTRIYSSNVNSFSILRAIGDHLQDPQVRATILAEVSLHKHCEKCDGKGIIPAFYYYCNGICFDCHGTGFSKYKDHVVLTENKTDKS